MKKTTKTEVGDMDENEYDRFLPHPNMGPPFYLAYQKLHEMVEEKETTTNGHIHIE